MDTSSFLKLFFKEPESPAVRQEVFTTPKVIISSLVEFEGRNQLQASRLGGDYNEKSYQGFLLRIESLKDTDPFDFRKLAGTLFETAIQQVQDAHNLYLRSMDRLHLAAMEELGIRRLITNDFKQAEAAQAKGFEVVVPE